MRERGYRPVQVWVPDVRTAQFAAEAHRQAVLVARADPDSDDQAFVEAVSVPWDDQERTAANCGPLPVAGVPASPGRS